MICQALIVLLRLHPNKLCHCQPIYKSYTLASNSATMQIFILWNLVESNHVLRIFSPPHRPPLPRFQIPRHILRHGITSPTNDSARKFELFNTSLLRASFCTCAHMIQLSDSSIGLEPMIIDLQSIALPLG